jgi:hypothetical protein
LRDPTDQSISTPYLWRFACEAFISGLGTFRTSQHVRANVCSRCHWASA